jgi:hypothetical protein
VRSLRAGKRAPARKAQIFDAVVAAGDIGITSREILDAIGAPATALLTIKAHVYQINDILAETDVRIASEGRGAHARWFL